MPDAAGQDTDLAIRTSGLGMVYQTDFWAKKKVALTDLNLEVPKGCIFGFLGQNGAGKTTTIKILAGLQFSTSGQAWLFGRNVLESESRRKIGFMPENPYFYEYLNAEETLDFYGRLSGMEHAERKKRTDELLAQFGLEHARKVLMRNYSKGMRQRLGLAQAVMHKPPLVILDEPMSGLDPLGRRDVRNAILALRDNGQTVFFSSHILGDVETVCDRVCVIHGGKQIAGGAISTLLTGKVLEVTLSFSGVNAQKPPALQTPAIRAWHDGSLYHVLASDESGANKIVAEMNAAGYTLRSMIPHRESLEEYFVRVTGQDARGEALTRPAGRD